MTVELVLDIFGEALYLIALLSVVLVLPSLFVGLLISTFQAATQINEQTLSFLPRLLTTFLTLGIAGPWMLNRLIELIHRLVTEMPYLIG